MILPFLQYGDIVWHNCEKGNMNALQKLCRIAYRIDYPKAPELASDEIIVRLGWEPLHIRLAYFEQKHSERLYLKTVKLELTEEL